MEKQIFKDDVLNSLLNDVLVSNDVSEDNLKRLVYELYQVVCEQITELDEIHTACASISEEIEKREEHEVELEKELDKAKNEIVNLRQCNKWYYSEKEKNEQLKDGLKAVATLINTILA